MLFFLHDLVSPLDAARCIGGSYVDSRQRGSLAVQQRLVVVGPARGKRDGRGRLRREGEQRRRGKQA
jgi:hypothetical protein